jgi:hypothetical protein
MAVRIAAANSAWKTAATWGIADTTVVLNSEANSTTLTTSYVESSAGTPGAITIDAILVKIASVAASPSGTMSVRLAAAGVTVPGTETTVNVSDLPSCTATSGSTTPVDTAEGGWFMFKLAAPVLLLVATAYTVSAKTSASSQVNLWRDSTAGNWSRLLRTTTTGAPAAGDDQIVIGEWTAAATMTARTVTVDETATTDYGSNTTTQVTPSLAVGKGGTVSFGTSGSTNYNLRQSGHVVLYNGGTVNIGSSGAEIPRGSTAVLQFDCTADGDFGIVARNGSTLNTAGLSYTSGKNIVQCKLTVDAAAAATALTVDTDTGWPNGSDVFLTPTDATGSHFEKRTLNADATSTGLSLSSGLTNAHSGTSPTQGEIGLLTRPVNITAVTANVVTFVFVGRTAVANLSWTRGRYLSTNATGKRGFDVNTTTGSFTMDRCSIDDADSAWVYMTGSAFSNVSITNTMMYNFGVNNAGNSGGLTTSTATSGTWTVDHCLICGAATGGFIIVQLADIGGTFTNSSVSGGSGTSTACVGLTETGGVIGTFDNLIIHSTGNGGGIGINASDITGNISNSSIWRGPTGNNYGIWIQGHQRVGAIKFTNVTMFGNAKNVGIAGVYTDLIFDSCTLNGDTTFSTSAGFYIIGGVISGAATGRVRIISCTTSQVSGIKTAMAADFDFQSTAVGIQFLSDKSTFGSTALYTNITALPTQTPFLTAQNFGNVANDNRSYFANGTSTAGLVKSNSSTVYSTNPLSQEAQPASASIKLPLKSIKIAVKSGKTITPTVQVRKNSGYNGNAPRLILKRQDSMGVTADTVLQTFSASADTWQALTGTTPAAPQDGVFEFLVDCDGTAGSAFEGDVTAVAA